jgi:hypothetical protein
VPPPIGAREPDEFRSSPACRRQPPPLWNRGRSGRPNVGLLITAPDGIDDPDAAEAGAAPGPAELEQLSSYVLDRAFRQS